MTVKRRAYTLMEILAVIAAIMIIMTLSAKTFRSLASDIPRANRDFQVWMQSGAMVESIKTDVESAVSMELNESGPEQTELLLQLPAEQVVYTLGNDRVVRTTATSKIEWELPHLAMQWCLWRHQNTAYAIEITTWVERMVLDQPQKKYEQSFVFFLEPQGVKP